jgi:hypothetical protein
MNLSIKLALFALAAATWAGCAETPEREDVADPATETLTSVFQTSEVRSERAPDGSIRGQLFREGRLAALLEVAADGTGSLEIEGDPRERSISVAADDLAAANRSFYDAYLVAAQLGGDERPDMTCGSSTATYGSVWCVSSSCRDGSCRIEALDCVGDAYESHNLSVFGC